MVRVPRIPGTAVFLAARLMPYALDEQGRAVPISVGELRSFNGQMDLVMIKPAAP
jgi:hypothetical protein